MQTKKIFPLSQDVIAKIAAGEVIERPVYAVKELIENALDAAADSLIIHIEESGLKAITVIDNGEGMSTDDLKESFKLHTTSKISSIDHLTHVATLGFRGEALASIAAISTLTIQSRTKEKTAGTKIEISNGKVTSIAPVGMPIGTVVSIKNLFHSVPSRKKFLKSKQTEFRHIVSLLTYIALANPHIHLHFTHNKKTIFDLPKTTITHERIKLLMGETIFSHLLPIQYQDSYIGISGFITKPHSTTQTGGKQFLFVNGRKITDKLISLAVKDAYGTLLEPKAQPIFVLNISLPFEFIDVNVHPRKEYIRFSDTKLLYDNIQKAVSQTLTKNNLTFYDDTKFGIALGDAPLTKSFAGRVLKENHLPWDIRPINETFSSDIIQLHNLYLVTQTRFGFALVDQHAAHERILYEQFSDALKKENNNAAQYHLQVPQAIEVSLPDGELLHEHLSVFEKVGFEIEQIKNNLFFLHALPLLFQDRNPLELITEMLEDLEKNKRIKNIDETTHKMLAYLACRAAVKAGESLTKKQAKELVEKLEQTNSNATCPHGRPTKVIIDIDQLHRMFKRK